MKNLSNLLQLTKQAASELELKPESSQLKPVVRETTYPNGTVIGSGPWLYSPTTDPMGRIQTAPNKEVITNIEELLARKKPIIELPRVDPLDGLSPNSTNIDFDKINKMDAPKNLFETWEYPTLDGIANIKRIPIRDVVLEYMGKVKDSFKNKDNPQPAIPLQVEEKGIGTLIWDWIKENPGLAGAGALGLSGLGYYLLKDDEDEEEED